MWTEVPPNSFEIVNNEFILINLCGGAKSLQSCLTLCDPVDYSPPGSSVHEILQARILKWVAMPPSMGSSWSRDQPHISNISCIGRRVLYTSATRYLYVFANEIQGNAAKSCFKFK